MDIAMDYGNRVETALVVWATVHLRHIIGYYTLEMFDADRQSIYR